MRIGGGGLMRRVRFYSQYIIFTKRFLSGMLENRRCGFSYFDDLPKCENCIVF